MVDVDEAQVHAALAGGSRDLGGTTRHAGQTGVEERGVRDLESESIEPSRELSGKAMHTLGN